MKLHLQSDNSVTLVENAFIDQYMPTANGEFVKLYLYLLRCASAGQELSISSIADFFDHTEKDVRRALAYWEKLDVIRLTYDEKGSITDIVFTGEADSPLPVSSASGAQGSAVIGSAAPGSAAPGSAPVSAAQSANDRIVPIREPLPDHAGEAGIQDDVPTKRSLSAARRRELREQEDIRQLIFVAETYLGRTLTPTEANNLLYFYDTLHFDADLIEYLVEYCASKGNPGARYMERVAQGWYRDGVTTVAQAKRRANLYRKEYYQIFDALGLKGRSPAPTEIEFMQRWLNEWGFSMPLIQEACARTILQTQKPSFSYTDGILKSWYQAGVHSKADIRTLDQAHTRRQTAAVRTAPAAAAGRSRFHNFPQRSYNYDELERDLYTAQFGKGE